MRHSDGHDMNSSSHQSSTTSTLRLLGGFIISTIACIVATQIVFRGLMPGYLTLVAIFLTLPLGVVGIRALGETDYNPCSGLSMFLGFSPFPPILSLYIASNNKLITLSSTVSQGVFTLLVGRSNPNAIIMNILAAGIAEGGASQCGDIARDFKIGACWRTP